MKTKIILAFLLLYQFNIVAQLSSNFNLGINVNKNVAFDTPIMMLNTSTINYYSNTPIELTYGEGKSAFLKSLIVPGLGLYKTSGSKKFLLLAPACYGTLGFGLYSRYKSKQLYNQYMSATDQTEINDLYDQSTKSFINSTLFSSIGVGLWIGQVLYTYLYGMKNDEYRERQKLWKNNELTSLRITPEYNTFSNSFNVKSTLIIKFK